MTKTRMFQALWLLLLSLVCVLMFYYRREPTKSAQELLFGKDAAAAAATGTSTPSPVPTDTPTPVPTIYEITEVFIPLLYTPSPVPPTLPPTPTPVPTPAFVATDAPKAEPFSLIWFSDTQYYAYKRPDIFLSMAEWATSIRAEYNAGADDRNYTRHWTNAEAAIEKITESMPFYCIAGNHDVGADKVEYETYLSYDFCTAPESMEFSGDRHCWVLPLYEQGILLCGIG